MTYRSSQSTNEKILCLCDYSPPPLVSTLMTYRAPLAGLLTEAAVTYLYTYMCTGRGTDFGYIHALNNVMDMLGIQPFVLCREVSFIECV